MGCNILEPRCNVFTVDACASAHDEEAAILVDEAAVAEHHVAEAEAPSELCLPEEQPQQAGRDREQPQGIWKPSDLEWTLATLPCAHGRSEQVLDVEGSGGGVLDVLRPSTRVVEVVLALHNCGAVREEPATYIDKIRRGEVALVVLPDCQPPGLGELRFQRRAGTGFDTQFRNLLCREGLVGRLRTSCSPKDLRHNKTLTALLLARNDLGYEDATRLAAAVGKNGGLLELSLVENNITLIGAVLLARGVRHNASLQLLDLRGNGLPPRVSRLDRRTVV